MNKFPTATEVKEQIRHEQICNDIERLKSILDSLNFNIHRRYDCKKEWAEFVKTSFLLSKKLGFEQGVDDEN